MIQRMLAIWSVVPLPFLKPAWTSGSSWFTYCWSLAWRILSIIGYQFWGQLLWFLWEQSSEPGTYCASFHGACIWCHLGKIFHSLKLIGFPVTSNNWLILPYQLITITISPNTHTHKASEFQLSSTVPHDLWVRMSTLLLCLPPPEIRVIRNWHLVPELFFQGNNIFVRITLAAITNKSPKSGLAQ